MRVLIISHNIISQSTNMGKTLSSYFNGWNDDEIAQFYIHSEVPTETICKKYYRVTDLELVKSIFSRKSGTIFEKVDINANKQSFEFNSDLTANIYQKGRKRTPSIYLARNFLWEIGVWKTKKLLQWVDSFNPDVVFFASGDYSFLYKVARKIAEYRNIPLVISCYDDYYINNIHHNTWLGRLTHKLFMKEVEKTVNYGSGLITICEKMAIDYKVLFNKQTYVLKTPSTLNEPLKYDKHNVISYIGNLDCERYKSLITFGKAVKAIDGEKYPKYVDVYSSEKNLKVINQITEENGLHFHGFIDYEKVKEVIGKSRVILHVESFSETMKNRVKYSVSTKIPDSLMSGTPLIAFGPKGIASIDYLVQENAAYCITSENNLTENIILFFDDPELQNETVCNGISLAKQEHSSDRNKVKLRKILESVCK